ncbi:o-antigen polymerase [Novosphingobium sp. Rr 2-17]|uniref:O-antigen ligase family protein n=1 Tax=Novosphingobium sp. Rr 2-17 TaxID=555793 RepID=UPI0002699EFE|nr:O-antigen ligase family protein [Novosphingobium sp. Rr 2-17]EIZ78462.1 o-antigen polymerase [Novosphingobium sp. Rr 2-17]
MLQSRYPHSLASSNHRVDDTAKAICSVLAALILFVHFGSAFGPAIPVVSLGAAVAIFVIMRDRLDQTRGWAWLLALPLLALLSSIWSTSPSVTLYYGAQLLITVLCALAIWLASDPRTFLRQLLAAATAICVVSIVGGQTGPSVTGPVLIGVTGSKNSMAAAAQIVLLTGLAIAVDSRQPRTWRLAGVALAPLGVWLVATTHAATIIILSIAAPVLYVAMMALRAAPAKLRPFLLAAVLAMGLGLAPVANQLGDLSKDYTFQTFHKDSKLSGRTYLWKVAEQKIAERPFHGYGYKAFWMSGSIESIGLLRSQSIRDPRTFSLHQTYLEIWLDTGLIGLVTLVATIAAGIAAALWRVAKGEGGAAAFGAVFLIFLVVRSFGETLIVSFYPYCTIVYVLIAFALLGPVRAALPQARTLRRRQFYLRNPPDQPGALLPSAL